MLWTPDIRFDLPRTGQATQYAVGDDGDVQAGWLGTTRFVDAGNGTIYDRASDLIWVKDPRLIIPGSSGQIQAARGNWANSTAYAVADLAKDTAASTYWVCLVAHTSAAGPTTFAEDRAAHPMYWVQTTWVTSAAAPLSAVTAATFAWVNAVAQCSNGAGGGLTYCGFGPWTATNPGGWRLPNRIELLGLADHENQTIYAAFSGIKTDVSYWSATTKKNDTTYAYYQTFATRLANYDAAKTSTYYVLPVRGGRING